MSQRCFMCPCPFTWHLESCVCPSSGMEMSCSLERWSSRTSEESAPRDPERMNDRLMARTPLSLSISLFARPRDRRGHPTRVNNMKSLWNYPLLQPTSQSLSFSLLDPIRKRDGWLSSLACYLQLNQMHRCKLTLWLKEFNCISIPFQFITVLMDLRTWEHEDTFFFFPSSNFLLPMKQIEIAFYFFLIHISACNTAFTFHCDMSWVNPHIFTCARVSF